MTTPPSTPPNVPSTADHATSSPVPEPTPTTADRSAPAPAVDLADPIWTIDHVAAALHLSVDRAREYSYLASFPAPRAGFSRHLWTREAVLGWFTALPAATGRPGGTATAARGGRAPAPARPARSRRSHQRRSAR